MAVEIASGIWVQVGGFSVAVGLLGRGSLTIRDLVWALCAVLAVLCPLLGLQAATGAAFP